MVQSVLPNGHFEFVNRAWCEKLGYAIAEVDDLIIWDIIHPDSVEHCQELFTLASQGQSIDNVDAIFITKDGRAVPVEGNATARVMDGEVIATHSFFRDVTEQKRAAELEVRNAQLEREKFARYLEKMAALGKLSAGLAHELNNPAAAAQRASSRLAESLDRRDDATRALNDCRFSSDNWDALAALVGSNRRESDDRQPLNPLQVSEQEEALEQWLEERGVENAWQLPPGLVQAGITEEKLEQLAALLPQQALEPAICWISESLEVRDLAQIVARSSHRISELVNSVKAYSYMDQATEQVVDIHEGLENTLIILAHRLRNITVRRDYDRTVPQVRALGSGLNQVWTNILDNAVDATGGHGVINIRTRRGEQHVIVEIEDDGCGISAEHLTRIFEPFFTTKQQGSGTGLGLDMAWRIVTDEHAGTLEVESSPGSTVFRISLPCAPLAQNDDEPGAPDPTG